MTDFATVQRRAPGGGAPHLSRIGRLVQAHWPFAIALAAALAVRIVATLGYPTVAWFGDSNAYLRSTFHLAPSLIRPSGYSIMLWLLEPAHSLTLVVIVQRCLGVAAAVMVYALAWRAFRGLRQWQAAALATLVAAPMLWDAYLIQLEQLLMADELFLFWVVAAVTVALWRARPTWWMGAMAGLLMGFAALTRSVGLPLLVVLVLFLIIRRAGLPAIVATVLIASVPLLAYGFWFKSAHGRFALTNTDQIWLYGRTVAFADCAKMRPPADLAMLCREGVRRDPRIAAPAYQAVWTRSSGFRRIPGGMGSEEVNRRAGEFAWLAIRTQPGDYARVVLRDTLRAFAWGRELYPTPWTVREYLFPGRPVRLSRPSARLAHRYGGSTATPRVVEPYARWIRGYQRWVYVRGTFLGILLLAGLGGMITQWRRWGGPALLPWLTSVALLVVPAATADFDYRYVLPAVPFAALAAGLALVRPAAH